LVWSCHRLPSDAGKHDFTVTAAVAMANSIAGDCVYSCECWRQLSIHRRGGLKDRCDAAD
jgi:hypothetical protein